jgi:hypothetical protein
MLNSNNSRKFDDFWHSEDISVPEFSKKSNLLKEKRNYFLVGTVVFTFILADLFIWNMYRSLKAPYLNMIETSAAMYPAKEIPTEDELLSQMKTKDTDVDTLNDYDELYVYGTSAYMEDSDSDGISDNVEISKGEDPLCAKGGDCMIPEAPSSEVAYAEPPNGWNQQVVEALRVSLEKSGIAKEQIDLFSDEELMNLYREVVSNVKEPGDTQAPDAVDPSQLLYFEQLGPAEIRELLIKAGVDPGLIQTIPDDRLKEIYLESLNLNAEENGQ